MWPKPSIAISADTFASPADLRAAGNSTEVSDTLSYECSAQIPKTPSSITLADSVFGSSHDPYYAFPR